ncbi:MAG: hypothetical protein OCD76_07340 [Reichenbachiella sp.]
MEELFQADVTQEAIIPETSLAPPVGVDRKESRELMSQVGLSAQSMDVDVTLLKEKASQTAVFEGYSGVRGLITETEFEASKRASLSSIATAVETEASDVLASQMLTIVQQQQDEFALENKAVDTLSDTLPEEIRDVVDESVLTDIVKDQAFKLKLRNFIAERQEREDDENILQETIDFFKVILPVEVGERLFEGGEGGINDTLRQALFQAKGLPIDQQDAFLRGPVQSFLNDIQILANNPQSDVDLMSAAADGSDKALDRLKFFQAIGVIAAPMDLQALQALKVLNVSKVLGNKKILADDLMKPLVEREIVKSDIDVMDTISTFKAPFDQTDGVLGEVSKNLDLNARLLNNTLDNFTAPESLASVTARKIQEFNSSYGGERVLNSNISLDNTGFIEFSVGTAKGTPFKSEKTAQNLVSKYKLDGNVIRHPSGGFSIKMKSPLSGIDSSTVTNLSWFSKYFGNIDNIISKSVVAGARSVEGAQNQVFQTARQVFDNSLKVLGTKRGKDTLRVIQRGVDNDKWLTPDEFLGEFRKVVGRDARKDEVQAYFGFKQLNDFDYELKNKILYEDSVARGEKSYTFNIAGGELNFNAGQRDVSRLIDSGTNSQAVHVLEDAVSESVTLSKGALDEAGLNSLRDTHDLLEVNPRWTAQLFDDGITTEPTKWVFVPKGSKGKGVSTHQLAYKAGGRRVNNSPSYLKVGRIKNGGDGSPVRVSDIATHGSVSKRKAKETAESLNEIYKSLKGLDDATAMSRFDELVASKNLEGIGITTAKQADEFFRSHNLYSYDDINFAGVRDREVVTMGGGKAINLIDETDEPIMTNIRNQMNGMRGDRLKNLDGEDSLILDPVAALADSLDTTTRFASVQGYRDHMLTFMRERFGSKLNFDPRANPIEILSAPVHQQFRKDTGLVRTIQAHQRYIEEVISKRTGWEEEYLQKAESAVNWAFDKGSNVRKGLQDGWTETGAARQGALKVATKDPAGRVKNLVFNAKLGLFNIPSFIIQAMNITNIVAISPRYGARAAKHSLPARLALTGGVDGPMRKQIAKGWKAAGFKSEDDFFEYIDEFNNLGLGHLDRGIADIAGANGAQLGTSKLGSIAEAGRVFFNEGEKISRLTSYGAARLRWLEDAAINPQGLKATSKEGRLWIQNESHRLSLGLSRQDVQLGFRGLAGVPTQFWSYPFRLMGAMLPDLKGARLTAEGSAFSAAEKTRLVLAQGLLYGSAGIPIADMIVNNMTAKSEDLDPLAAKAMTNGAIDAAIYALTDGEANTNFAGRAGGGQFFTDIVRDIRDKSAGEFVTGAGGQTLSGILGTVYSATQGYGIFNNPNISSVGEASWAILKAEISSLKLADKTQMALRFGHLFAKSGVKYAKINDMTTFLMVGGIPPQAYENLSLTFIAGKERTDMIKELSGMFVKVNGQIDDAFIAGDTEKVENLIGVLNILGAKARDLGITDEVVKGYRSIENSSSMLEKRVIKMQGFYNRTPDGNSGTGVNQNVLRQELEQEQE